MKISNLKRKDIETCAFLIKLLQSAKYEVEGSAVKDMHDTYQWVHDLSVDMANGWNAENMPKDPPKGVLPKGVPSNVKIKNPGGGTI